MDKNTLHLQDHIIFTNNIAYIKKEPNNHVTVFFIGHELPLVIRGEEADRLLEQTGPFYKVVESSNNESESENS